ncbi:MAG TPA: PEPxxWA-CTERM sorting domain-containing protein [Sphingomicrobium sp.]|nr:PEPxxWA-CTERM sorting domain-containing protein [Sphingomicrobium sp.]
MSSKNAPKMAVLSERTPASKPRGIPVAAALATPMTAVPAAAGAAIPVPVAAAPLAAAAPALLPAAATAGSSLFIPPLFIPGGGGAGAIIVTAVTPPPGGGSPPPVPGVPEPETWAMMILGFGFVGAVLRRRRRGSATEPAFSPAS